MALAAQGIIGVLVSFCLGSIPFAVLIGRVFFKTDIREHGSGNPGTTNVFRTFGPAAGVAVLVLDVAKGAAAVAVTRALVPGAVPWRDWILVASALAAMAGHSFSPFIGLRGGKGVATAAGAVAVLMPAAFAVLLMTFIAVLMTARMVSLASITLAAQITLLMVLLYPDRPALLLFGVTAGALVIWRHRSNIRRILSGEEPRVRLPWQPRSA